LYKVKLSNKAVKELDKIDFQMVKKLFDKMKTLGDNPKPIGSIKLKGENAYRIRLGNYRIIYEVIEHSKQVLIYKVAHRKDVYKGE
jgi:mRNA interferase RelE/StbE